MPVDEGCGVTIIEPQTRRRNAATQLLKRDLAPSGGSFPSTPALPALDES